MYGNCSIWSISCNGTLQAGIIGGKEILFKVDENTDALVAVFKWPSSPAKMKREANSDLFQLEAVVLAG